MLKIKLPNNLFASLVSSLKNALLKKKANFIAHFSKFNLLFSYFCLKKKYFSRVEIYNLNYMENKGHYVLSITINYIDDETPFYNIINLYSKCRPIYLTVKKLKRLYEIEKSLYFLSTSMGILTTTEALSNNVGGICLIELR